MKEGNKQALIEQWEAIAAEDQHDNDDDCQCINYIEECACQHMDYEFEQTLGFS